LYNCYVVRITEEGGDKMTEQESQIETVNSELTEIEGQFSDLTKKKISLLERKIKALDKLLQERDKAIRDVRVLRGLVKANSRSANTQEERSTSAPDVVAGEFKDMYVWEAVQAILRRERQTLRTGEIVDRLRAGGKKLNDKNPASQVHASLRIKTNIFHTKKDAGKTVWGLVEWNEEDELGGV
jgi:uncharacterized coiled-coil protein SlyX